MLRIVTPKTIQHIKKDIFKFYAKRLPNAQLIIWKQIGYLIPFYEARKCYIMYTRLIKIVLFSLSPKILPEMMILMLNSVVFRAKWRTNFNIGATGQAVWTITECIRDLDRKVARWFFWKSLLITFQVSCILEASGKKQKLAWA